MQQQRATISVVLPSYNEREIIAQSVRRVVSVLGDRLLEVIVVDDNSPDRTWEVVENLHEPRCRLIRRTDERGLASALSHGTKIAKGDVVVWMDCDLGMPPEVILELVAKLKTYDIAVGSRYLPGGADTRHKFRAFLSYLFNVYARCFLGRHFWDWTSGFAAVRREVIAQVPLSPIGYGEYFIEWIYACTQKHFKITEVPYRYEPRTTGESKTDSNLWVFLRLSFRYALRVIATRVQLGPLVP